MFLQFQCKLSQKVVSLFCSVAFCGETEESKAINQQISTPLWVEHFLMNYEERLNEALYLHLLVIVPSIPGL